MLGAQQSFINLTANPDGTLSGVLQVFGVGLPARGQQGNFQVSLLNGAQTFGGILTNAAQTNLFQIVSAALTNFVFTPEAGYNGTIPLFGAGTLANGFVDTANPPGGTALNVLLREVVANNSTRFLSVSVETRGQALEVGRDYPIGLIGGPASFVNYGETAGAVQRRWSVGPGTTRNVRVTSLSTNAVELDFNVNNLVVTPADVLPGNQAAGTLSTRGHIRGDLVGQ